MHITPIKTERIRPREQTLTGILDRRLKRFPERSVLAITSKIVSLCEGRVAPLTADKEMLIREETDYYLPKRLRKNGATGTITHHAFIGSAGIDRSNVDDAYVLLPRDSARTAGAVYRYLRQRFGIRAAGVIITDSHSTPMRRGASGISLAYRGFVGLKDYRGTPDIFGRPLAIEQANIADALAVAAVLAMGEGDEQTPLALIEDLPGLAFSPTAPTKKERDQFYVPLADDIFAPLFNLKRLKKGLGSHTA